MITFYKNAYRKVEKNNQKVCTPLHKYNWGNINVKLMFVYTAQKDTVEANLTRNKQNQTFCNKSTYNA